MSWPDIFHIRVLPAGCAMVNCMSQLGGFLMPFAWGVAKDATGGFEVGLLGLASSCVAAFLVALSVRRQVPRPVGSGVRDILYPGERLTLNCFPEPK